VRNPARRPAPRRVMVTALAVLSAAIVALPSAAAGQEDDAQKSDVERLRRDVESAYLDVQKDHQRVRAADWDDVQLSREFAAILDALVKDARSAATPDVAAAASAVRAVESRHVDAPLTRTSLHVVLAETVTGAAADRRAASRDVFVGTARRVFSAEKTEDVWDGHFLGLPAVEAFRVAQAKQQGEEKPAPPAAPADKAAEKPADKPAKALDEQVFLEKARPWLGPWTGWTMDIAEKLNKRQQRAVKAVWFDRYEVTCAQYHAFLESVAPAARKALLPAGWTMDDKDAAQMPAGKERHPVTGVTWRQAQAYAESQGKRLPTCDEWERAAAGAEKEPRVFPWGNSEEGKTWAGVNCEPKATFPVDAFPDDATPEGIVGMAGNVAEIVSTHADRTDIGKAGPEKNRQVLVCGGSYAKSRASECATSYRWVVDADASSQSVGFRCVMDDAEYKKRHK
jgi:formylglycine-generating enzyme required for sulfatase activity